MNQRLAQLSEEPLDKKRSKSPDVFNYLAADSESYSETKPLSNNSRIMKTHDVAASYDLGDHPVGQYECFELSNFYIDLLKDEVCTRDQHGWYTFNDEDPPADPEQNQQVTSRVEGKQLAAVEDTQLESTPKPDDNELNYGPWSPDEQDLLLEALQLYGKDWDLIQKHIRTRDVKRIRAHAQKLLKKLIRFLDNQKVRMNLSVEEAQFYHDALSKKVHKSTKTKRDQQGRPGPLQRNEDHVAQEAKEGTRSEAKDDSHNTRAEQDPIEVDPRSSSPKSARSNTTMVSVHNTSNGDEKRSHFEKWKAAVAEAQSQGSRPSEQPSLGHSIRVKEAESGEKLSFKLLGEFWPLVQVSKDYSDTMSNRSMLSVSGDPLKKKNYRGYMDIYERMYVNYPQKLKRLENSLDVIQEVYENNEQCSVEKWKDLLDVRISETEVLTLFQNITYENRKDYFMCMLNYEYLPCQFVATLEKIQEQIKQDIKDEIDNVTIQCWGMTFDDMKAKCEEESTDFQKMQAPTYYPCFS